MAPVRGRMAFFGTRHEDSLMGLAVKPALTTGRGAEFRVRTSCSPSLSGDVRKFVELVPVELSRTFEPTGEPGRTLLGEPRTGIWCRKLVSASSAVPLGSAPAIRPAPARPAA